MRLGAYLLAALVAWLGIPGDDAPQTRLDAWARVRGERAETTRAHAAGIAEQLAHVAGDDMRRALELAAVASLETQLAPWALDGRCNARWWRLQHPRLPTCDGGNAWGAWQVHLGPTVDRLVGRRVDGASLLADASAAWALYRVHPEAWTTHLKAVERATAWSAGHPWRSAP